MKKLLLSTFLFICFIAASNAQQGGFRVGGHAGIPLSDASDFSSFNIGADATYHWNISEKFALGAATGYAVFMGKDDFDNYSFIPVAASARAGYGKSIFYTADLGYAVATDSDTDGGLYLQAKLGWTNSAIDAFIFYKNISADNASLGALGIGIAFKI